MKKVCVVTAARSEYGLLRWILEEINKADNLQLQLLVTGGHLSPEQGLTYKEIENDNFKIDKKIEFLLSTSSVEGVAKSMGVCAISVVDAISDLKPDLIVVLGDRYELLPICSAALVMQIPIAHISGGDITEGAIDNKVRDAVTMMSNYHFAGTETSANRIRQMIGCSDYVFTTGETNLDNFVKIDKLSKEELADYLGLSLDKKWVLCTYHSETTLSLDENMKRIDNIVQFLIKYNSDTEIIITASNADYGGTQINSYLSSIAKKYPNIHFFNSLGVLRYVSILQHLFFVIGNSSSAIFETPISKIPAINVGDRQKGRYLSENIVNADGSFENIVAAFEIVLDKLKNGGIGDIETPYGDGYASERSVSIIENLLTK